MNKLETRNYDNLNMLSVINRPIKSGHVAKLKQSIIKHGNLRVVIVARLTFISGTPELYVIDGQHLITALRALRMPVEYIVMEVEENYTALIDAIARINTSAKKWILKDYVYAWKHIKREYVNLEQYHLRYSMSYNAIGMIAMNVGRRSRIAPIIKDGRFVISNSNFRTIAEAAFDLLSIEGLGTINSIPQRFVEELLTYYNNTSTYDHARIRENVANNINVIKASATTTVNEVLKEVVFN